jgi:predicted permease
MAKDVLYAIRTLARTPLFTAVAIFSLALGIGANTAIFSLLRQVILRRLPVAEPNQLVVFHFDGVRNGSTQSDNRESVFSYPIYREFRDRSQVFQGVCARAYADAHVLAEGQAEEVRAEAVSGNFFDVLGIKPRIGRLFLPDDDVKPMGHPVAVISHAYWVRRFGANPAILRQSIRVNTLPFRIVGVAPESFRSVISGEAPDLWVPLAMRRLVNIDPGNDDLQTDHSYWLSIFARSRPGISMAQAAASTDTLYRALLEDDMARNKASQRFRQRAAANHITLLPASQGINQIRGQWEKPLSAVMAMVGLVLLIACANVSNLLIARAAGRRREIAVRLAIGAGRWTLIRQLLTESLLLAVAGGISGLLLAWWIARALLGILPTDAFHGWLTPTIDLPMLGFAFAVSLAAGVLFGLAPALSASRPDLAPALRDHGQTVSRAQAGLRRLLVAAQVALSLVLLITAGLFTRSLINLLHHDLGFRPERLLIFRADPSRAGYEAEREQALLERLRERFAAIPGVTAAGAAAALPLSNSNSSSNVTVEGYRAGDDENTDCEFNLISPGYFQTLGVPLAAGREFTAADNANGRKVAIVNQEFVRHFFRDRDPLGRHFAQGAGDVKLDIEIVGVVKNSNYSSIKEKTARFFYFPYLQRRNLAGISFMVRTAREDGLLAGEVRRIVREIDANVPVSGLGWMQAQVDRSISIERLTAWLATGFGALAMLLAVVGLYGVIAYMAARRTAEIGVRIALGATRGRIIGLVLREVIWLLAAGLAIGVPAALAAGRYIESQLFGLHSWDLATLVTAAVLLSLAALAAGYVPARRAASIDPLRALRYE